MNFKQIQSQANPNFSEVLNAYQKAFPPNERRSEEQLKSLLGQNDVKILIIEIDEENIGYIIVWECLDFLFLEHFEIYPKFRNRRLGSQVLEKLSQDYRHLILESEPATLDETANKRMQFYLRNGFKIIDKNYIQPAYDSSKQSLNLWLLSNQNVFNKEEKIKEIYLKVYKTSY